MPDSRGCRCWRSCAQLPHRRRELLAVRADQLQRYVAADAIEQQLQAPCKHILAQVQPGFVGDAFAGYRPAPHHIGVIADQRAAHRNHAAAPVDLERPAIIGAATELVDQAIMLAQIVQARGHAAPLQIVGRRREYAPIAFQQGQGDVVGVVEVADADGHVDRVAEHVGHFVGQAQVQAQPRVRGAKGAQPGQQQISTEVRRRRQLQGAVQFGVFALHARLALAQGGQYLLRIRQVQRPSPVRRRLRVVRTNSRRSSSRSSRATAAATCPGSRSASRAACEKLPSAAVRTNSCRSSKRIIFIARVKVLPDSAPFRGPRAAQPVASFPTGPLPCAPLPTPKPACRSMMPRP